MDAAIRVEGLSKRYRIGSSMAPYGRLTESLWGAVTSVARPRSSRRQREWIWALQDVSLEIERGQVAGIVGRNGAGKTTLLKVLSRITEPTSGRAHLDGRVGSLLEVGTGFHPELTGRENIYLNGAILGMGRSEIARKFDEIVSFAEVEKFLDTPVKRYSSGMHVRLAFAVAAHLEPEILMVDEVLAVGDAAFQKRCLGKMGEVAAGGRTILFVSHNLAAIKSLCTTGFLLDGGSLQAHGPIDVVLDAYARQRSHDEADLRVRKERKGDGRLRFTSVTARRSHGAGRLECGAPGTVEIGFEIQEPLTNVHVSMALYSVLGEPILYLSNELTNDWFDRIDRSGSVECSFDRIPLLPGSYRANLYCTVAGAVVDWVTDAVTIEVENGDFFGSGKLPPSNYGVVLAPHRWRVTADR
jgi:lipopolysaccharide transport system ATP-binding protein